MHRKLLCCAIALACAGLARVAPARPAEAAIHAEFAAPALRSVRTGDDDLLTAGLGIAGLRGAAPQFADPLQPTATELRRRAIWQNYRGLIDLSEHAGFGRLYGAISDLRVEGVEYLAALRDPRGEGTTTLLLQIPNNFSQQRPCLIVVAASGSRGIYGALPTAGEWGLRHGCAVAHSDKGSGFWDVERGIGMRIDGVLTQQRDDPLLAFAPPGATALAAPAAAAAAAGGRYRVLLRHANSGVNPESRWGEYLLQALDGGMRLLNEEFAARRATALTPANTLVIAAGISNGGGAVLRAAEIDSAGWIDGVVAAEPNVAVDAALPDLTLRRRGRTFRIATRPLYDYATLQALLQPCAALAEGHEAPDTGPAVTLARAMQRDWCAQLAAAQLVQGGATPGQAQDARHQLLDAGLEPSALNLADLNLQFGLMPSITANYAAAYSRSGAAAQPCGIEFAALDTSGMRRQLDMTELARLFSDGSGLAPTAGILDLHDTQPARDFATALCLRGLLPSLQPALHEIQLRATTGRRPVIVLHGRDDALIAVNHSSRAWFSLRQQQPHAAAVRYYEIEHVQHFDAFLPLPQLRNRFLPMQPFLNSALDLMWQRLLQRRELPQSQLWRTSVDGEPLTTRQLGTLRRHPGRDRIAVVGHALVIPD